MLLLWSIRLVLSRLLKRLIEMIEITPLELRGDRPAWSTAVGLGPIPYRFAGSNPAPRTIFSKVLALPHSRLYLSSILISKFSHVE